MGKEQQKGPEIGPFTNENYIESLINEQGAQDQQQNSNADDAISHPGGEIVPQALGGRENLRIDVCIDGGIAHNR